MKTPKTPYLVIMRALAAGALRAARHSAFFLIGGGAAVAYM